MIQSFRNKESQLLYEGKVIKKWQAISKQLERRLEILDNALTLDDLRHLPSNRFEALSGDRKGQFSIRVNIQWRICFEWIHNELHYVEIVD